MSGRVDRIVVVFLAALVATVPAAQFGAFTTGFSSNVIARDLQHQLPLVRIPQKP
jgi:hypothetical protein